jgi:hypothetical protein
VKANVRFEQRFRLVRPGHIDHFGRSVRCPFGSMISFIRKTKTERGPFRSRVNLVAFRGFFHLGKNKQRNSYDACWVSMFSAKSPPTLRLAAFSRAENVENGSLFPTSLHQRTRVPGREATKTQTKASWRICGIAIFPRPVGQTHETVGGSTISSFGAVLIKASMVRRFESKRHYLLCEGRSAPPSPSGSLDAPP